MASENTELGEVGAYYTHVPEHRIVQVPTPETCPLPDCSETCDCTWMTVSFLGMCHDTIRPSKTRHLCSLAAGLRQEE